MGCPGLMDSKNMEQHLVSVHSKEELWRWSINYDKIVASLGSGTCTIKNGFERDAVKYKSKNEVFGVFNNY